MEVSKADQTSGAQSRLNIVKVVQLKRFLPKANASPVFKRKISFNNLNANLPNIHSKDVDIRNKVVCEPMVVENKLNTFEKERVSNVEDKPKPSKTELNDNQKCKIKFRGCSHTPEELSKLTEHRNETLVKIGEKFETREAFRKYLNDNAKRWFYYYVCRTSKKNVLEYNCICMPYTLKPKDVVLRKQKKRTTACPCKIRLTVDGETKNLVVYYVCNHHDHDLTEDAFYHYPHAKYLPQDVKDVFLDLAYLGLDIDLIQNYIHSLVGITIKRKDISSYAYKFKRKTFLRNLTDERRKYIKELITTIWNTHEEAMDHTIRRISEEDCEILHVTTAGKPKRSKRRKSQSNSKEDQNSRLDPADDDAYIMNYNEPVDKILDDVLDSKAVLENYDVIVQYINEDGILCDQNGTPVTNSSAIMQFINNYEYVMPECNVKDEFLEEGTVFSELVENIGDDIYPSAWDVQGTQPVEKSDEAKNGSNDVTVEDEDAIDADIEEIFVKKQCEPGSDENSRAILSNFLVNCDKRVSPTREGPAVYAEMDNFKKYYFVDHRYIKYEEENSNEKQKAALERIKRQEHIVKWAKAHGEEYIKAPKFDNYPSPLRHCSGHEDLTLLSDPDAILPGAKFLTLDVFLKHINERANRWFFYYSLAESGKVPEFYVYKCVFGKNRTSRNAYRAKGIRKRSKLTTQCPCQIRLRRLYSDSAYLTVLYSCNHHDHALDAQLFRAQPHSRRLPGHIKEEVKDLLSLGAKFDVLRRYVTSETGLRVYGKYFHNVRVKMAREDKPRQFTEERFAALTQKLKDLETKYGSSSKENPQYEMSTCQTEKRRPTSSPIQMEDQYVQVGYDEAATQTQEYQVMKLEDVAEEVSIIRTDASPTNASRKHSRLETRLQNLSSHEETLLKVKKLQESVRSDSLRNTYEVVQYLQ